MRPSPCLFSPCRYPPEDPATRRHSCPHCGQGVRDTDTHGPCGTALPACVFSGRTILDKDETGRCGGCKRRYLLSAAKGKQNCALCHTPLSKGKSPGMSYGALE